ncbi:hypothetical protein [Knoellia koreensis]|uniref:Uncharacterized protein n=1 Tax=Knoellia koreensis TaxID=2730921 RepID=A0A849HL76_9MICO|nr:hypothetical protein [Knoellia sp. DB2414S]NNM47849.1 hypothetical protein [Knoellia sp. DB2414S]
MLNHSGLPLVAAATGLLFLGASLRFRLPEPWWVLSSTLGLTAVLIPSVSPHYAKDHWDLLGLVLLTACTFAANMHASRTRVAQLPLTWRARVDAEMRRLTRSGRTVDGY